MRNLNLSFLEDAPRHIWKLPSAVILRESLSGHRAVFLKALHTATDTELDSPVRAPPVRVSPVRTPPVRALPVRVSPVRVSPVRVSPVRAPPVRVSTVRTSPVLDQAPHRPAPPHLKSL